MSDTSDLEHVRTILEAAGLRVDEVPKGTGQTCDLRAHDGTEQYFIEVKGLHDDEAIAKELRKSGEYSGTRSVLDSSTLRKHIRKAVRQIEETQADSRDGLWFLALLACSRYGRDVTADQILGTLYGTRSIVHAAYPVGATSTNCLYFSHSAFHHHPDIDGVLVSDGETVTMCLNDFGRRISRVRRSALGRFFASRGVLNDATTLEQERGFFVAGCEHDRNEEHRVLQYVSEKYHLDGAIPCSPDEISGIVAVPDRRRNNR